MSKQLRFRNNFPGLQLFWDDFTEIESIGYALLNASSVRCTHAHATHNGRRIDYHYPVSGGRKKSIFELTYTTDPTSKSWPRDWQYVRGRLIVVFNADNRPIEVKFQRETKKGLPYGKAQTLELDEWKYMSPEEVYTRQVPQRGKVSVQRYDRKDQNKLRNDLYSLYGACQITETTCREALEACHVVAVAKNGVDRVGNALLLRRDIHALFDAGLLELSFDGNDWIVLLHENLQNDQTYSNLHAKVTPYSLSNEVLDYMLERDNQS